MMSDLEFDLEYDDYDDEFPEDWEEYPPELDGGIVNDYEMGWEDCE